MKTLLRQAIRTAALACLVVAAAPPAQADVVGFCENGAIVQVLGPDHTVCVREPLPGNETGSTCEEDGVRVDLGDLYDHCIHQPEPIAPEVGDCSHSLGNPGVYVSTFCVRVWTGNPAAACLYRYQDDEVEYPGVCTPAP